MSDSTIRRRDFIAGATAVTGLALASDAQAATRNSLYNLTPADFEKLIGERFHVDGTDAAEGRAQGTLVLKEVVSGQHASDKDRPAGVRTSGFSLRFEGPANLNLAPGTHAVAGGGFSQTGVFLNELADQRTAGTRQFEAVFN